MEKSTVDLEEYMFKEYFGAARNNQVELGALFPGGRPSSRGGTRTLPAFCVFKGDKLLTPRLDGRLRRPSSWGGETDTAPTGRPPKLAVQLGRTTSHRPNWTAA